MFVSMSAAGDMSCWPSMSSIRRRLSSGRWMQGRPNSLLCLRSVIQ